MKEEKDIKCVIVPNLFHILFVYYFRLHLTQKFFSTFCCLLLFFMLVIA